jgi:CRISPR/Cas system-associated endoribonuclease Cas2
MLKLYNLLTLQIDVVPVSSYALRRNFIQRVQTLTDDKKSAVIAGYRPESLVRYTKYDNTFSTLDVVKIVQNSTFAADMPTDNPYVNGIRSVAKLYVKLSREEYDKHIRVYVVDEEKQLKDSNVEMKEKYGSLKDFYDNWDAIDYKKYKSTYQTLYQRDSPLL